MQRNVQGSNSFDSFRWMDNGYTILGKTIDTSGNAHSSQYLLKLVNEAIKACEEKFKYNEKCCH